jgi:diphthine-ammonia ligase
MKLGVLFSGGKDSVYSAYLAKKKGYELSCLISINSKNKESFMFHTPSIGKTKVQAKVMNIPLIIKKTKGEKEKELADLESAIKDAIKKYQIEGIVTGAIESVYQATRVQKICDKLGLECFNPLWQKDEETYWEELMRAGFRVIIVSVAAWGLDESLIGREINRKTLKELRELRNKFPFHLVFEGGEAETFVVDCPLFSKKIKIIKSEKKWDGQSGKLLIRKIDTVNR